MAENSKIQWCDNTFNPWRGCQKISEGCKFCYAERGSGRNPKVLGKFGPEETGGTRVLAAEAQWKEPLKWNARCEKNGKIELVFCASLADVFEEWRGQMQDHKEQKLWRLPDAKNEQLCMPGWAMPYYEPDEEGLPYNLDYARRRLFWLIRGTPHLRWLLLAKRADNIAKMMPAGDWPNVWMGVSVENQEHAWRVDALKEAPQNFARKFISYEPALGPLTLWENLEGIDWVIMGGESGGEARECNVNWYRAMIAQCRAVGAYPFVKQMGKVAITGPAADDPTSRLRLSLLGDPGHGGEMEDWPADLRIREIPPR